VTILEALRDGATYEDAARSAGISPRTFRRWRRRYGDLETRVQRAEAEAATAALDVIGEAAESGDWRAASWLLEQRHGYGDDKGKLSADGVRAFVGTVQDVIREECDAATADQLMNAIGDRLEEVCDG
jgi:hypothetical protein